MPQIEMCQECGAEVPRRDLVRKLRRYGHGIGANYLAHSRYASTFWACDATDAGDVSMGCFMEDFRPESDEGDLTTPATTTEIGGAQSWTGSGTFRQIVPVDVSGLTRVCFSAMVGAYHAQATQEFTVAMGLCSSDGSTKYQQRTWTVRGALQCWFSALVAGLDPGITTSAVYFYIEVTIAAGMTWWVDDLCLADLERPDIYQPETAGAAVVHTEPGYDWTTPILCPACAAEGIHRESTLHGTDNPRIEDEVEIRERIQEL